MTNNALIAVLLAAMTACGNGDASGQFVWKKYPENRGVFQTNGHAASKVTGLLRTGGTTAPCGILSVRNVPSQYPTIQAAIDAAMDGDTVLVAEGTYYENIRFKGKRIVVGSAYMTTGDTSHISRTVIDGSRSMRPDSGSVVYFVNGEDTSSVLCGFTVTGGTGTLYHYSGTWWWREGGGVYCASSGARLVRNSIVRNRVIGRTAGGGGVAALHAGTVLPFLILESNRITDNYVLGDSAGSWGSGGGADICGVSVRITGNLFERDTVVGVAVGMGGGMQLGAISDTYPGGIIQGNTFRNNFVDGRLPGGDGAAIGGGVFCFATAGVLIDGNAFIGNIALAGVPGWTEGGGICIDDEGTVNPGRKVVSGNRFIGNRAQAQNYAGRGGAIDLYYTMATVSSNYIARNSTSGSSGGFGGGIRTTRSSFRIENNIITNNLSSRYGGGMCIQNPPEYGTVQEIVNNTCVGNKAAEGGGLDVAYAPNVVTLNSIFWADSAGNGPEILGAGQTPVLQYCNVAGGYAGPGNINADPLFVVGDSLYNLTAKSPCIGFGIDSVQIAGTWYRAPDQDFDGHLRARPICPQKCDIGAHEEQITVDVIPGYGTVTAFELAQNYPNPFNPSTTIRYSLPARLHVSLKVFNTLGQEVVTLVQGEQDAGYYEVKFDAQSLSSGVYFYRLNSGSYVETKKMIIAR